MQELILQNIVEDLSLDSLPAVWQNFDFKSFSKNKTLYDFQQDALKNAVKALYRYYSDKKSDKEEYFKIHKDNGIKKDLDYNLSKFVEDGYGKHIYLSEQEVSAFRDKSDFSPIEKQMIVLKTLLLLAYVNKYYEKVRKIDKGLYHRPLLLTLVNSVNTEDAETIN